MEFKFKQDLGQLTNKNGFSSLPRALESFFNEHEKKKARFISSNRVRTFFDSEETLGAEVRGNQGNYLVSLNFKHPSPELWNKSKLEDFKVSGNCSCPAFENDNRCKHVCALARNGGNSLFANNFSAIISEYLSSSSRSSTISGNKKQNSKQPITSWQKYIKDKIEFNHEHEVLQENLIKGTTPRKYFLLLDEPINHLKEYRKFSLVYRSVKKSGELGSYQDTGISKERLERYPDPNFTYIGKSILNIPYKDTNYYMEEDSLGYSRHSNMYQNYISSEINRFVIKPAYENIIRQSARTGRLSIFSKTLLSQYSKPNLEELTCLEGIWQIKYKLSKSTVENKKENKSLYDLKCVICKKDTPSVLFEEDRNSWVLNIPSQTIWANNKLIFLEPVPLPELALDLVNKKSLIEISHSEIEDFLLGLSANNQLDHFIIPEDLLKVVIKAQPKATLILDYPANNTKSPMDLCGFLEFHYGHEKIAPNDQRKWLPGSFGDDDVHSVIDRDLEKELELLTPLAESLSGMDSSDLQRLSAVSIPFSELFPLIEKLMLAGWEIKLSNQTIRNSTSRAVSVSSGVDWFEIRSDVSFDGEIIQIDKLIQAVKENKNFITFNNGKSLGVIPPELVRRLQALSQIGTLKDGKIRLGENQALWIDLLLKDQLSNQDEFDSRIESARTRLSSLNGIKSESPARTFKGTLRDYQQFGLGWLKTISLSGFGACLADDMGLGKTVQILALLDSVLKKKKVNGKESPKNEPCLIVAPKTLLENWIREAAKFTPKLKVITYHGQTRKELQDDLNSYDIILTTYATLSRDIISLKDIQFSFVILDEAQAIKNSHSLSAKSCLLLKSRYRIALTGTPIENSVDDLLSIFEFLNPGMLGQMARKRSEIKNISELSPDTMPLLSQGLLPFILRRTKAEVLKELPPKTEQILYCELTPKQQKLYDKTKEHYKASLSKEIMNKGMLSVKMQFLEALLRLRQICCDPRLVDPKLKPEDSTKLQALIEELAELQAAGKKALIFSQFTSFLSLVADELKSRKFEFDYLDGKTKHRQLLVDRFQNFDGSRFFLISIKAGGVGLNLTSADYCFILDPWWNPAVESQAIDRAHRIGQENPVFAYKLIAQNSVEEKIIRLQESKKELAEVFTSENSSFLKNLSMKDFEMIFD